MSKAKIVVTLKRAVLDPQGRAVEQSLSRLGFDGVSDVRVGRFIELKLNGVDASAARERVEGMCKKLLANTVIEDFHIEIED
ncbi:MAG: phosphoribosylformylglycinamidine synthase subunit PurS [Deltaproteobacteria bacterium]|nr:phosphoribosylformylglycinamidine synthase subunit PurS [Deltaproteobacteria bacterium]